MDPESRKHWQLDNPCSFVVGNIVKILCHKKPCTLIGWHQSHIATKGTKLTKRVQNYAVQGSSCESCQEDHRLYACSQFKGMCLSDRHKFVKDEKHSTTSNQDTRLISAHLSSLAVSAE